MKNLEICLPTLPSRDIKIQSKKDRYLHDLLFLFTGSKIVFFSLALTVRVCVGNVFGTDEEIHRSPPLVSESPDSLLQDSPSIQPPSVSVKPEEGLD